MNELFNKCMEEARRRTEHWGNRFWAARGALNKGTLPPPPPKPTPAEISAANSETAEHLSRLQRSMQFGEPMLKKGYRQVDGQYFDSAGLEVSSNDAIEIDFTERGDTDLARKEWEFQQEMSPQKAEFLLEQAKLYGPEFVEQAREMAEKSDPTGFAARELLGKYAQEYQPEDLPQGPQLESLTYDLTREADPETLAARKSAERDLISRMESGGFARRAGERAERIARGRAAATGNIYGGGAIAREARIIEEAQDSGQRQAVSDYMGFLQSGQSAEDYQTRLAQMNQQNQLTGMASRNTATQQAFQNAMGRATGQEQLKQQQMANLQSFSGLAPVASQFGLAGGAQQAAAANFMPTQYEATSGASLYGMNQGLAQGNYQGAMNAWQTQAQIGAQPSGFGQILGGTLGAFAGTEKGAGAITGGLGALFGGGAAATVPVSCHTARLVFGEDNPEWYAFYLWKEHDAPKWFRAIYNKYTERFSGWLKDKPRLQTTVRNWMRSKIYG